MADSDLETSIECSKNRKFFTLPLDVTADSLIDSAPFDSSDLDHDQENEADSESPVKGRGRDSFSMASYLQSFHQSLEHSLQAGYTEPIGPTPTPLSTQIRNKIIEAYSESTDANDVTSGIVGHLNKVLGTQEEMIKKLRHALEKTLKERQEFEHETGTLSKEVDSLRAALETAMEERDRSPSITDLTSFMTLPDVTQDHVPNNHVIQLTLISQEVQTDEVVHSSNHTSVQASSPMTDNSTQYLNLGFMADSSCQADHQDLVNTSVQVVPETAHAFTQVLNSVANTSSQAGTGFATIDTAAQTNLAATAELGVQMNASTLDTSMQTVMPSVDSSDVLEKCRQFQNTISALREELGSVKNVLASADPSQFKEIVASVQALYEEQAKEMSQLKRNYSRDLDMQNEAQIQLRVDLEAMRQQKEEVSRSAAQETTVLKTKITQLEDARRSAEHRLVSFSSRLSPEGSELDVDTSLTDSAAQNGPMAMDHSHMSRTKLEYLTLTPPGCIDDGDVIEDRASSEVPHSVVDDLKLQLSVLEKKYEVNRRYLEEQTADRELERDDFLRQMDEGGMKLEEARREKERLEEIVAQQKLELDDYDIRLREATDIANELGVKSDKVDEELKSAVDKIYELREIIRDLEDQIDSATVNVEELKEQNQLLTEALEKAEAFQKEQAEEALNRSDDTYHTATSDLTEELFTQVQDLATRLEAKLNEMDNFKWSSRPASSCSGGISVSTEDVSVRELSVFNRGREVTSADLADGLRRLDNHFESFVRFEEVIMKKLRDTEMRLEQTRKRQEELEVEKLGAQNKIKEQILKISELESRLDQMRFEPSPNAVTLSGLRARVKALTEDLEEHKGQLQLKTMEVQDLNEKQEATQAMLQKYKTAVPKREPIQVKRSTVYVQTEKVQSDTGIPKPKRTQEIAVQTRIASIDMGIDYITHPHDLLDISSIPGGQGPIHSTPNEGAHQRSSKRTFRSWVEGDYEQRQSPEVLRQMTYSKSDRLATVPEMNRSFYSDDEQQKGVQVQHQQCKLLAGKKVEMSECPPPKPKVCCPPKPPCPPPATIVIQDCGGRPIRPVPKICPPPTSYKSTVIPQSEEQATSSGDCPARKHLSFEYFRKLLRPFYSRDGEDPKEKGLGKRISTNTLHGIDSVNDFRSWGLSAEDKRRHFLEQMNQSRVEDEDDPELENDSAEGNDGLTEFVEVDDPSLVLGPSALQGEEEDEQSTAIMDQTRTETSPTESSVNVENFDGANAPDAGLNKTSEGSLGGGGGSTSGSPGSGAQSRALIGSPGTGTASAVPSNSPSMIQKAPSRSGSASAESSGGGALGSSPSTSQNQSMDESSSNKIPFGISQSQTALPSQAKKGRSPCIPSDCVQGELLNEIQQLKEDKIRLEAKLEFTIESFRNQQAQMQQATPPQQPPNPPSPPPSQSPPAGPPNTDCVVTSPEQGLLLEQVKKLKQEREELERRLDQRQGQGEAAQCEAERKIKEASSQVTKLEREKRELEFRLQQLESNNEQRGRQLEDVMSRITQERNALQCEIQRASKQLQDEIQKRNVLQTKFNNSVQILERQREMDLRMRQENESLRANLEMLNSRVQTMANQTRPQPVNDRTMTYPGLTQQFQSPGAFNQCSPGQGRGAGPGTSQGGPQSCSAPPYFQNQMRLNNSGPARAMNDSISFQQFAENCGRPNTASTPIRKG